MRALVAFVVVAAGCSVDVGAGSIAPVAIDEPIDATLASPPASLDVELEFLSADQSTSLADQYGSKLGAVKAIDVDVQTLAITDVNGATVAGGVVIVAFRGRRSITRAIACAARRGQAAGAPRGGAAEWR